MKGKNEIYYALDQQRDFYYELSKFTDENFIFLGIIPDVDGLDFGRRMDTIKSSFIKKF